MARYTGTPVGYNFTGWGPLLAMLSTRSKRASRGGGGSVTVNKGGGGLGRIDPALLNEAVKQARQNIAAQEDEVKEFSQGMVNPKLVSQSIERTPGPRMVEPGGGFSEEAGPEGLRIKTIQRSRSPEELGYSGDEFNGGGSQSGGGGNAPGLTQSTPNYGQAVAQMAEAAEKIYPVSAFTAGMDPVKWQEQNDRILGLRESFVTRSLSEMGLSGLAEMARTKANKEAEVEQIRTNPNLTPDQKAQFIAQALGATMRSAGDRPVAREELPALMKGKKSEVEPDELITEPEISKPTTPQKVLGEVEPRGFFNPGQSIYGQDIITKMINDLRRALWVGPKAEFIGANTKEEYAKFGPKARKASKYNMPDILPEYEPAYKPRR